LIRFALLDVHGRHDVGYQAAFGEIGDDAAPRLGRPRRFWTNFVGGTSFGGAICLACGGIAMSAWRNCNLPAMAAD